MAGVHEGVALVHPTDGVVLWANGSFAALVATEGYELVGRPVAEFVPEAVLDAGGTTGPLDVRVFTVDDPNAGPLRVVAVARREVAGPGASFDLAQFASVAAHDLRSPLQAVMGFGELLASLDSVAGDPLASEYATLLLRSVQRMHALVDDLLNYFRVGAGPSERSAVDCGALLVETVDALERDIAESGAVVTCDDLPVVEADAALVFVVLSNLVSNALKFPAEGTVPRVHVTAGRDGGDWRFSVTDNGIGMDPRFRQRAFEMFRRLPGSEAYAGTGMGLAICKRAVESLHGRIWAESNDGGGTRICFTLPAGGGSR